MSEQNSSPNPSPKRPLTEMERDQLRKKRDALIKKRTQELKNATAERKEEIYEESHYTHVEMKPQTFQEKWDNYWYHYKGLTFGLGLVLLLASLFIYDIITKDRYDLQMMCITQTINAPLVTEELQETLEKSGCISDIDGKQGVNVFVDTVIMDQYSADESQDASGSDVNDSINADPNFVNSQYVKYAASLSEVMDLIYIVDQANYDRLVEEGITFVDLSELFDHPNVEGNRYYLKDNPLFSGVEQNDNWMLVVRNINDTMKSDEKELQERLDRELEMVGNLIEVDQ